MQEADRRCEMREISSQAVTITNLPDREVSILGHLTDISPSGIGLILEWPLCTGASCAVEWDDVMVFADVVHCYDAGGLYRAGLKTSYIILDRTTPRSR